MRALSACTHREIIFLKKIKGLSNRAIARALKCSEHGVHCVLKKEAATGQVADLPRSGRPQLLSKKRQAKFDSLIQKNRSATAVQLAVLACKPLWLKILARTAQRERKRLGYQRQRRTKTMALNKFDQMFRVKWCQRRRSWHWANTVFIDITTVRGVEAQGYVWAKPGENIATQRLEGRVHGPQVFVLGAISREGTCGISLFHGRLNTKGFKHKLAHDIVPAVQRRHCQPWVCPPFLGRSFCTPHQPVY